MKKLKIHFYGIRLKNSRYEKIHNNLIELENHLDKILYEYNKPFIIETIAEKIVMLENIIVFKEYKR